MLTKERPGLKFRVILASEIDPILGESKIEFPSLSLGSTLSQHHLFICAWDGDAVAGIAKLYAEPDASNIHLDFLEVAEAYRHHGVAKALVNEIFNYASANKKIITSGGFTEMGKSYLAPLLAAQPSDRYVGIGYS